MARNFLPEILPGLLGIFIATLLAAVMSSCDSFMIAASGLFTENLYRPLKKNREPRHYLQVGRIAALVIVALGVVFALWVEDVVKGLMIWFKITPMMGIAFWLGLFWRKATVAGAWASTLAGFGTWWLLSRPAVIAAVEALPFSESWRLTWEGKLYEPWVIVGYMAAALLAGIVVSLLTRPVAPDQLDRYYTLTRTPIAEGEEIEEPCTLPEGVAPAQRKMLLNCCGFEIPVPSKTTLIGFLVGWVAVGALIGGFILMLR